MNEKPLLILDLSKAWSPEARAAAAEARRGKGTETYKDEGGRTWDVTYKETNPEGQTVFLGHWRNRDNYLNIALFVQGTNKTWISSLDGPFMTKTMREEYRKQAEVRDKEERDKRLAEKARLAE